MFMSLYRRCNYWIYFFVSTLAMEDLHMVNISFTSFLPKLFQAIQWQWNSKFLFGSILIWITFFYHQTFHTEPYVDLIRFLLSQFCFYSSNLQWALKKVRCRKLNSTSNWIWAHLYSYLRVVASKVRMSPKARKYGTVEIVGFSATKVIQITLGHTWSS